MRASSRAGFTLIEVVVALTVSGIAVLAAERTFAAASEGSRILVSATAALDRDANAVRLLRSAFASLDVGEAAGPFEGHAASTTFFTWLQTAGGWHEPERVVLGLVAGRLELASHRGPIVLADSIGDIGIDYLLEQGEHPSWVHEWLSPVSAPIAVRLRITRAHAIDTLLLLVGPRG